jgi:hypothetical protein
MIQPDAVALLFVGERVVVVTVAIAPLEAREARFLSSLSTLHAAEERLIRLIAPCQHILQHVLQHMTMDGAVLRELGPDRLQFGFLFIARGARQRYGSAPRRCCVGAAPTPCCSACNTARAPPPAPELAWALAAASLWRFCGRLSRSWCSIPTTPGECGNCWDCWLKPGSASPPGVNPSGAARGLKPEVGQQER